MRLGLWWRGQWELSKTRLELEATLREDASESMPPAEFIEASLSVLFGTSTCRKLASAESLRELGSLVLGELRTRTKNPLKKLHEKGCLALLRPKFEETAGQSVKHSLSVHNKKCILGRLAGRPVQVFWRISN